MFVEHKEQGEVTEAPAKTLKYSTAIRIGARLRPQGFDAPITRMESGTSCAMQAMAEGMTGKLLHTTMRCIRATGIPEKLGDEVWHKNDCERWTRERIADWLESEGY